MIKNDNPRGLDFGFRWISRVRNLVAPLCCCVSVRLLLMTAAYLRTGTRVMTQGDTSSYLEPGRNLILQGSFVRNGIPEIDRTPGYPLFAELTGMIGNHVLLTILMQVVLSLCCLLLIDRIAEMTFHNGDAARLAAWLFAVEPISAVSSVRIMPETVFVLLVLTVIERLLVFHQKGRLTAVAAAGVGLAASAYFRPVSYYLVFPLAVALVFARRDSAERWKAPALLLLCTLPWLALWQVRNHVQTGYHGFSSIVEKNLYYFQSAQVTADLEGIPLSTRQNQLGYQNEAGYLAAHPDQRNWTQARRLQFMRAASMDILSHHRLLYLRTHFAGVVVVALTPCASEFLQLLDLYPREEPLPDRVLNRGAASVSAHTLVRHLSVFGVMLAFEAWLLLLFACAVRGFLSDSRERFGRVLLVGLALYFLLISGGAQAVGRYRVPVMPVLCILAAGGIARTKKSGTPKVPLLDTEIALPV